MQFVKPMKEVGAQTSGADSFGQQQKSVWEKGSNIKGTSARSPRILEEEGLDKAILK